MDMSESAKKIEAIPTPADELRNAIAVLQAEKGKLAAALIPIERLRSLDKDATEAQTEVNELAAAQAQAFRDWAASGAEGKAPVVNERASREAAQRLDTALRQRQASHAALSTAEANYGEQAATVKAAETAVMVAAANVLGSEALDKYERYRRQFTELLVLEHEIVLARDRLLGLLLPNASTLGGKIGEKLAFDRLRGEENIALRLQATTNESGRWQAILNGDV